MVEALVALHRDTYIREGSQQAYTCCCQGLLLYRHVCCGVQRDVAEVEVRGRYDVLERYARHRHALPTHDWSKQCEILVKRVKDICQLEMQQRVRQRMPMLSTHYTLITRFHDSSH
jgi:hypothetical protein